MKEEWWESPACWFCDYGLFLIACLVVLAVGIWRFQAVGFPTGGLPPVPIPVDTSVPIATASSMPATATSEATGLPFGPSLEPKVATPVKPAGPTSTPPVPDSRTSLILVFVPLNWQGDRASFEAAANHQASIFVEKSSISQYIDVSVAFTKDDLPTQDLTNLGLVDIVVQFGSENYGVADHYIGLTNSDLSPGGVSAIAGWTAGEQGMVVESIDPIITAHELGHIFGLCDEYSFGEWTRQNNSFEGGCPNPYPANCPTDHPNFVNCDGAPNADGAVSIMGPAGLPGEHAYNEPCLKQLTLMFQRLSINKKSIQ